MQRITGISFQGNVSHYYELGPEDMKSDILAQLPWVNNSRLAYDSSTKISRVLLQSNTLAVFRDINYSELVDSFKSINITFNEGLNPNKILSIIASEGHFSAILRNKNDSTSLTQTSDYRYDFGSTGHQQGGIDGYLSFAKADKCHVNWEDTEPKKTDYHGRNEPINFSALREAATKETIYETEYNYLINHIEAQHSICSNVYGNVDFVLSDEEYAKLEKKLFDIKKKCESGEIGYSFAKNLPNTENCVSSLGLLSNVIDIDNPLRYFTDSELNGGDKASNFAFHSKYMNKDEAIFLQVAKSYMPTIVKDFYEAYPTIATTVLASLALASIFIGLSYASTQVIWTSGNSEESKNFIVKSPFILVHPRHSLGDQLFVSDDDSTLIALEICGDYLCQKPVKMKEDGLFTYATSTRIHTNCNEEASDREHEEQVGELFCLVSNLELLYYTKDSLEI